MPNLVRIVSCESLPCPPYSLIFCFNSPFSRFVLEYVQAVTISVRDAVLVARMFFFFEGACCEDSLPCAWWLDGAWWLGSACWLDAACWLDGVCWLESAWRLESVLQDREFRGTREDLLRYQELLQLHCGMLYSEKIWRGSWKCFQLQDHLSQVACQVCLWILEELLHASSWIRNLTMNRRGAEEFFYFSPSVQIHKKQWR